jgi:hypothetical protein
LIAGERLATLKELETWYSYEDALNMAEIIQVRHYNERVAADAARSGR